MIAHCRATLSNFSRLWLVGKTALPSTSGENAPFRERISAPFRYCTIKVHPENRRKPAPHGAGHRDGDWLDKGRLERAKGFEP
jgi:hypothetical protein